MLFKRRPFPRIQHINARPQAPVVVFELHVIHQSSSLRGRGDPVAVGRPFGGGRPGLVKTHYSISRRPLAASSAKV